MAKVWKDHPMFGKIITYRDGDGEFKAEVVNVKAGPMLANIGMNETYYALTGTIRLLLKPIDGPREAFWTPPVEYKEPAND